MMLGADFFNIVLRFGELVFAAVVAGITGDYLHSIDQAPNDWSKGRFIYIEIVAGLSLLFSLLWLFPFSQSFVHWPVDLVLFIAWIVAFGLLVQFIGPIDCGSVFYWGDLTNQGICQRWKADAAFSFLSAFFWLGSALLGIWVIIRARRGTAGPVSGNVSRSRRHWYRSSRV